MKAYLCPYSRTVYYLPLKHFANLIEILFYCCSYFHFLYYEGFHILIIFWCLFSEFPVHICHPHLYVLFSYWLLITVRSIYIPDINLLSITDSEHIFFQSVTSILTTLNKFSSNISKFLIHSYMFSWQKIIYNQKQFFSFPYLLFLLVLFINQNIQDHNTDDSGIHI